jgi:hypothetical protein
MPRRIVKPKLHFFLVTLSFIFSLSCFSPPNLIGCWRELGKNATLEFRKDGTFKAVDNEGMSVTGKYSLLNNGTIQFEVPRNGSSPDIIKGKISIIGDEFTFISLDGRDVERYRRKP